MTNEIRDIVENLVLQMNTQIIGEYDANDLKTYSCDTKWARIGKIVKDSLNNEYLITDIAPNEWILTNDTDPLPPNLDGVVQLPVPYFISGTKLATNSEWTKATPNLLQKTPLIWLLEVIRLKGFGRQSAMELETDLRLFFLDETNVSQYYTADHRENVVYPMEQLAMEFINTIGRNRNFKTIEEYEMITFSRFGVERDNGVFQNILDANLSGVELRIRLEKFKENCIC
jgi:hypothetical protein